MSTVGKTSAAMLGLGLLASAVLLAGSVLVPTTAVEGGGRTLEGWWMGQAGLAVGVAAFAARARWRRAALLASALLLGTAAQLDLTSPLWLQFLEMRPDRLVAGTRPIALLALAVQLVAVLGAARGHLRPLRDGVRRLVRGRLPLLLLCAPVIFVLSAAHATIFFPHFDDPVYVAGYLAQLVAVGALLAVNVTHLWLLGRSLPARELVRLGRRVKRAVTLPGVDRPPTRWDRRLPLLMAAFAFSGSLVAALVVFERVPHIPDELAYLFQARQLAEGVLSSPVPPVPEAFTTYLLDTDGRRWWATTNPGWAGGLAVGVRLGAPWLVNPVLTALGVLLLHLLVSRLSDRGTAHLCAGLAAVSPWLLFLGGSFMTHPMALVLTLSAWLLALRAARRDRSWAAMGAGLALGYSVLIRPLDGLVVGVLTGLWLAVESRWRWRLLFAFAAGSVLGSIWLLPYNAHFTNEPLRDPMAAYLDELWYPGANRIGFGDRIGPPGGWGNMDVLPGHGPVEAVLNANQNLYNVNFELHGWALGSLFFIAAHLLLGRLSRLDRQLALFCSVLVAAYSLYWFSGGPDFGARYWFLLFVPAVVWSARGVRTLGDRLRVAFDDRLARHRLGAVVALLVAISLVTFSPWRAIGRYTEYRDFHADYRRLLESGVLGRSLVLVDTEVESDLVSALSLNHPSTPADRPLFARDLGAANHCLIEAFPDRPVVRLRGRRAAGDRVEVPRSPPAR